MFCIWVPLNALPIPPLRVSALICTWVSRSNGAMLFGKMDAIANVITAYLADFLVISDKNSEVMVCSK